MVYPISGAILLLNIIIIRYTICACVTHQYISEPINHKLTLRPPRRIELWGPRGWLGYILYYYSISRYIAYYDNVFIL